MTEVGETGMRCDAGWSEGRWRNGAVTGSTSGGVEVRVESWGCLCNESAV